MFKQRIAVIIIAFLVSGIILFKNWNVQEGLGLPSSPGVLRPYELRQDLGGEWEGFPSLRTAWTSMSQNEQKFPSLTILDNQGPLFLPSSAPFKVAARKFRIPSEWSSREMVLTLRGVTGQAAVYLNGISLGQQLAVFDGNGGSYQVNIPPTALQYGKDNVLLIAMSSGTYRRNSLFGLNWPMEGKITGSITLDAVMENIDTPEIRVKWEAESARVIVKTTLTHAQFADGTGWTMEGVLSDGSAEVASNSVRIEANGNSVHDIELEFRVSEPKLWGVEAPYLYHLLLTVTNDKGDSDRLSLTLGLRKLTFNKRLSLNDKIIPIQGALLNSESEAAIRRAGDPGEWLKNMRGKGINLIYFLGFPDELWFDAADRIGMGIWAEWPVGFIPNQNLPDPDEFRNLVKSASRHPSLWGWTVGKGLNPLTSEKLVSYWTTSVALAGEVPAFILEPPVWNALYPEGVNLGNSIPADRILPVTQNALKAEWGEIKPEEEGIQARAIESWKKGEPVIARVLAFWSVIVLVLNIQAVSWRYKELQSERPKRPLRQSWLWHGIHFLTRETAWAAILTSMLFQINPGEWSFFREVWPLGDQILLQSPWLIWLNLALLFMLLRILQIGVVAPFLPGSPPALGLVYWFERRFRWFVLVVILWAVAPVLDIPLSLVPLAYLGFSILFLPLRIRDVHRAGGKYRGFLLVPALLMLIPMGGGIWRWPDLVYLWQWIYFLILPYVNL